MPSLDKHGELAAATIAFYIPLLVITFSLTLKRGFRRDAGWVLLFIFSLVRIVGGALLIAAELIRPINTTLYIVAVIFESIGLSPLLLATIAFLVLVGQNGLSQDSRIKRIFVLLHVGVSVAMILSIVGGTDASSTNASTLNQSQTLRRAGSILFLVLYIVVALIQGWYWSLLNKILPHHRTLLKGISAALPFLGVRMIYSVLSAYSSLSLSPDVAVTTPNSLSKFNLISGDWWVYLVMALLMEYIVICIYTFVGVRTPLQQDYATADDRTSEEYEFAPKYARGAV